MIILKKPHKRWIYLALLLAMLNSNVIAEEQNTTSSATFNSTSATLNPAVPIPNAAVLTQDSTVPPPTTIAQFISFFDVIKLKLQHLFDISLAPKIMAIINTIESQCNKLIELITGPPNHSDPEKINTIINNIDTQRQSLWDLISSSSDQDTNPSANTYTPNMNGTNKKDNTFRVYAK